MNPLLEQEYLSKIKKEKSGKPSAGESLRRRHIRKGIVFLW